MRKGHVGSLFFILQSFHRCRENATQCFPSPLVLVPTQARQLGLDYAKCMGGIEGRGVLPGDGSITWGG